MSAPTQPTTDPDATEPSSASAFPPRELLSEAEERFERWRKTAGAIVAPIAFLVVYLSLSNSTLSPEGRRLSGILAAVAVLWMTEALPLAVTALLAAVLCVALGIGEAKAVFAPFADPMIFLFLGSFILARAMQLHALDRRIALGFLSLRIIGGRPPRVLAGMGLVSAFISMWVSNTATTAMMLPIALGILTAVHTVRIRTGQVTGPLDARHWPFATGMMLMIAYAASIGGIGTKVGSPPNLITLGQLERAGISVSFFQWMAIMVPMVALMFILLFGLLYLLHRDKSQAKPAAGAKQVEAAGLATYIRGERDRLGPWTAGQRNTLIVFTIAVALWILPGFLQAMLPDTQPGSAATTRTSVASSTQAPTQPPAAAPPAATLKSAVAFFGSRGQMPEAIVALVAALLLFVLPTNFSRGEFTMTWAQAVTIDWGTLLLFGGGMALGDLMFKTGVADALGRFAVAKAGVDSMWGLTAAMIVLGIFLSETTSNTAAATMLAPIAITIATKLGVSPLPPALGACLGASYGFMLPVSTPPNAIAFGSGLVPISKMVRAGFLFDILGLVVIWVGLRVLCPLLGLV